MDPTFYVGWIEAHLAPIRAAPPEAFLLFSAIATLLFALSFASWRRASRRARTLERANAGLDVDLAVIRTALEHRRLAGEMVDARSVESAGKVDRKSPRELLEMLEGESFNAMPSASKIAIAQEHSLVATVRVSSSEPLHVGATEIE